MTMYNGGCFTSFPKPPSGFPSLLSADAAQKRLKLGDIEKSVQRLHERQPGREAKLKAAYLGALSPRKVLAPTQLEAANKRLYEQEMTKRKAAKEQIERQLGSRDPGKLLDKDTIEQSVERLFRFSQLRQKEISSKLREKYGESSPRRVVSGAEELKALNDRFYTSRSSSRKERSQQLMEKYVYSRDTAPKKMDKKKLQETCNRLSSRG
eukprot:TRINITY_DN16510_c0_g1_i1.p2 TRINITY_DN16510_c0_g1~~TRINITY_DN16510_c0_g1_i1.p2  ORF type:complete len:209 (+),score=99.74 TRINITY_DN16510_c0_g1_i1:81-707(+)